MFWKSGATSPAPPVAAIRALSTWCLPLWSFSEIPSSYGRTREILDICTKYKWQVIFILFLTCIWWSITARVIGFTTSYDPQWLLNLVTRRISDQISPIWYKFGSSWGHSHSLDINKGQVSLNLHTYVKTILELIKTCLTDLQNVPKICNIQQGFYVLVDLEAQKYAMYNKDLVHFDPKNMQICHLHMVELPRASHKPCLKSDKCARQGR